MCHFKLEEDVVGVDYVDGPAFLKSKLVEFDVARIQYHASGLVDFKSYDPFLQFKKHDP